MRKSRSRAKKPPKRVLALPDPIVYLMATTALVSAALLASYLPARRASRLDPVESLRAN